MRTSELQPYALAGCLASALLAGCAGSQPALGTASVLPQSLAKPVGIARSAPQPLLKALHLYVANAAGSTVTAYKAGHELAAADDLSRHRPAIRAGLRYEKEPLCRKQRK
jgi:hypothetical protein